MGYTVKNKRNFTDPVMGNCDKKSTGNREFTGKCPYILYINGQFTVLLRFSVNSRAVDRISRDLRYIPRKICCREMPRNLKKRGISRQQIFRGIYRKSREIRSIAREFTENLQKNRKLAVNI